jgi:hypothetical protein
VRCQPFDPNFEVRDEEEHPLRTLTEPWSSDKHRVLAVIAGGERPIPVAGTEHQIPGYLFDFADSGRHVVDTLRVVAVEAILDGFAPAFAGEAECVVFTRPELGSWCRSTFCGWVRCEGRVVRGRDGRLVVTAAG